MRLKKVLPVENSRKKFALRKNMRYNPCKINAGTRQKQLNFVFGRTPHNPSKFNVGTRQKQITWEEATTGKRKTAGGPEKGQPADLLALDRRKRQSCRYCSGSYAAGWSSQKRSFKKPADLERSTSD